MSVRRTPLLHPFTDGHEKGSGPTRGFLANWGKNITLISSLGKERGMGASLVVEGSTNAMVFETYLQEVLLPTLKKGQLVVMDDLSAHKGQRVRDLIEARGCQLIYLPPYSPDFSPIEEAFSKLKMLLRKAKARTRVALLEAIGRALPAITPQDAAGYFGHCGYPLDAQPS